MTKWLYLFSRREDYRYSALSGCASSQAGWFAFQFLTFFGCKIVLLSKVSPDDHPLVVQFAANDPAILLDAALWAQDVLMSTFCSSCCCHAERKTLGVGLKVHRWVRIHAILN